MTKEKATLSVFWRSTVLTFALLMNATLCYSLFFGDKSLFAWQELHLKFQALSDEFDDINEQKALLSQEIRLLQTDTAYVEKLIRQRLNYVRKDEILYIFGNDTQEDSPWIIDDTN